MEGTVEPGAVVPPDAIPALRRNLAYGGLIMVILMTNLDTSIVNVALPQLSRTLGATPQNTVWVTTVYLLTVGAAVPAAASVGDQIGRRRLFLAGVPAFTLASLGCALSNTLGLLIAFRATQGLGAAMIFATVIPIMRMLFPPERMGVIFGVNAMATALGMCAGPTLGGLILVRATWPWLFLINVPVGVIAWCLGAYGVPRHTPPRGRYDLLGALTIACAITAFLLGMHQLADPAGWWLAALLLVIAAGLVAGFVRAEKAAANPVLPPSIWNGVFSLSVTTAFATFFGQGVAFVALPFLFQSAYGASPLRSALLFTPWPAVIVIIGPIAGRLADRVRPSVLALVGLVIFTAGLICLATLGDHPSLVRVLACTALAGAGFGLFQSPNNKEMQGAVPLRHAGAGAAVLNLNRSVAQSAGSGAVSMALVLAGAGVGAVAEEARAATSVLWVGVAGAALAVVGSAAKLRTVLRDERTGPIPVPLPA